MPTKPTANGATTQRRVAQQTRKFVRPQPCYPPTYAPKTFVRTAVCPDGKCPLVAPSRPAPSSRVRGTPWRAHQTSKYRGTSSSGSQDATSSSASNELLTNWVRNTTYRDQRNVPCSFRPITATACAPNCRPDGYLPQPYPLKPPFSTAFNAFYPRQPDASQLDPKVRVVFFPPQPCPPPLCMPPFLFNRMAQPFCSLPVPPPLPQISSLPLPPGVQQRVIQQYANPVAVLPWGGGWAPGVTQVPFIPLPQPIPPPTLPRPVLPAPQPAPPPRNVNVFSRYREQQRFPPRQPKVGIAPSDRLPPLPPGAVITSDGYISKTDSVDEYIVVKQSYLSRSPHVGKSARKPMIFLRATPANRKQSSEVPTIRSASSSFRLTPSVSGAGLSRSSSHTTTDSSCTLMPAYSCHSPTNSVSLSPASSLVEEFRQSDASAAAAKRQSDGGRSLPAQGDYTRCASPSAYHVDPRSKSTNNTGKRSSMLDALSDNRSLISIRSNQTDQQSSNSRSLPKHEREREIEHLLHAAMGIEKPVGARPHVSWNPLGPKRGIDSLSITTVSTLS